MKKIVSAALSAGAALVLSMGTAHGQSVRAADAEGGRLWFVELAGAPETDGNTRIAVDSEKSNFKRRAATAGVRFKERRSYSKLFNGYAVEIDRADRAKLLQLPGVKAIYPVDLIHAPRPERTNGGSAADMATAVAMTGADIAHTTLGLSGAGVRVGVMDTGIDIDHPDLGGTGVPGTTPFPSARVTHGWDFVGDAYNADPFSPTYNPVPAPDANPDDCNGHGTHVAGIIGANGRVRGVAPNVTFGAYRVLGCDGSTTADILLAAMERALDDGMHVLNISIGASAQWPQYPTAQAASRLVRRGVVVIASIGNDGSSLYAASAPGVGEKVVGVASFDNSHLTLPFFTVSPDGTRIGYSPATGAPLPPTSGSAPIGRTSNPNDPVDGCFPLPEGSFAGRVVLIRRGGCSFYQKAFNVQAAGAVGVLIYNFVPGVFSPSVEESPPITIPVVGISDTDGVLINNRVATGQPVTMTWSRDSGSFPNVTGGLISGFSSYGLAADLSVKPNLGAPGGLIFSTYPLEQGGFATLSGTSMASPHVAGGVALLLQSDPRLLTQEVAARLQNSADPRPWWAAPTLGYLDNVHRQGAGMLDIAGAVRSTTTVEPAALAVGESQGGPARHRLVLRNRGNAAVTYNLSHASALASGPTTFEPTFFAAPATVTFSAASVTVPRQSAAVVDVTVAAPADATLADRGVYGGYIVLTPQAGGPALRVPYAGFKGDYQSIPVLTPTSYNFPWLARLSGGAYHAQLNGATYTMVGDDVPFFLMHLDHQSARVKLEVFNAVTGRSWYKISDQQFVARNNSPEGFFDMAWDGHTFWGNGQYDYQRLTVPNGRYVVKITVVKALGNDDNPAHVQTWTSPVITIARP